MRTMLPIVILTYKEGVSHRVLYGVFSFAVLFMLFSILFSGLFMRDIQKIILDLCLTMVSIGGLLIPFFLAINLLSGDIERKTVYTILAQPLSRTHYILGKFFGFAAITLTVMGILLLLTFATVWLAQSVYTANFFTSYSPASILLSCAASFVGNLLLISCVLLWCSVTTSSFLATMLTAATYIIGQTSEEILRFMSLQIPGVDIHPAVQKTVQAAMYIFPNLAAFDLKQTAAHGIGIPLQELLFLVTYGIAYITVILTLTTLIFRRRDLA